MFLSFFLDNYTCITTWNARFKSRLLWLQEVRCWTWPHRESSLPSVHMNPTVPHPSSFHNPPSLKELFLGHLLSLGVHTAVGQVTLKMRSGENAPRRQAGYASKLWLFGKRIPGSTKAPVMPCLIKKWDQRRSKVRPLKLSARASCQGLRGALMTTLTSSHTSFQ